VPRTGESDSGKSANDAVSAIATHKIATALFIDGVRSYDPHPHETLLLVYDNLVRAPDLSAQFSLACFEHLLDVGLRNDEPIWVIEGDHASPIGTSRN
jgi:hypothetical protein